MEPTSTEEIIWSQSEDGIRLFGVVIRPAARAPKPVAVVHVPGWDVGCTHPLHILISRELARHGYLSISGNHRGWPFGEIAQANDGYRIIGAAWERFTDCPLDIGGWIAFAASLGFDRVVLLGQSLGAAKVVWYQAQRNDPRVGGIICASPGPITFLSIAPDAIAIAHELLAQGRGNDLLPMGSYAGNYSLSAQTLLEWSPEQRAIFDVFGMAASTPPLAYIQCPLLAFYGTNQDIGSIAELDIIQRNAINAHRVETRLFDDANHTYTDHEQVIGVALAAWIDRLVEKPS